VLPVAAISKPRFSPDYGGKNQLRAKFRTAFINVSTVQPAEDKGFGGGVLINRALQLIHHHWVLSSAF